jgi:hypothetical protein
VQSCGDARMRRAPCMSREGRDGALITPFGIVQRSPRAARRQCDEPICTVSEGRKH